VRFHASIILIFGLVSGALFGDAKKGNDLQTIPSASKLASRTLLSEKAYCNLASLCDDVGNRLSGSENYNRAVVWALKTMKDAGLQNVHTEKVMVPRWVRNRESAHLISPCNHELSMLGLGMSVPTPKGGITADVLVVSSLDELASMKDEEVKGRIVLFEFPFESYGQGSRIRFAGPSAAAKKGAVAMIMRSVTHLSLDTPHTGSLGYKAGIAKIPAAAVSVENAAMMRRMWEKRQKIQVHLEMSCETLPDVESANVIGELKGSENPGEIILVSGHLDSWDVGQGAQDDGVGCVLALQAVQMIKEEGLKPARTIRVVFFANEENGTRGGEAYLNAHGNELKDHIVAIESDAGNGLASGFSLEILPKEKNTPEMIKTHRVLENIKPILEPLGAAKFSPGFAGVDIEPIVKAGVPGLGMKHDTTHYWEVHHSKADTFEKIKKDDLAKNAAILAVTVYSLANSSLKISN